MTCIANATTEPGKHEEPEEHDEIEITPEMIAVAAKVLSAIRRARLRPPVTLSDMARRAEGRAFQ